MTNVERTEIEQLELLVTSLELKRAEWERLTGVPPKPAKQLTAMNQSKVDLIEELRHHAADIQQVVAWLHAHAPDRFDARLSMGQLITGILSEWLYLRQPRWKRVLHLLRRTKSTEENGATDDR